MDSQLLEYAATQSAVYEFTASCSNPGDLLVSGEHPVVQNTDEHVGKYAPKTRDLYVRCPNCGTIAKRSFFSEHKSQTSDQSCRETIKRTECFSCDYLMIVCAQTERVLEAYF